MASDLKALYRIWSLILLLLVSTLAITCPDGSYDNSGVCEPCHSSCFTCENGTECLTCDEQTLNLSSKLCEYCPEGEYFDTPSQICRSCGDSCLDKCAYQTSCFQCPTGEVLNLSTLTCIPACSSVQIKIKDAHFQNIPFCRDNEYYVDPSSMKIIELGTEKYPYKSINLVFVELLNIRSHSEDSITIFLKENTIVNIEKGYNYIANISSVKIESYGSSSQSGRATLYVRQSAVEMFNSQTLFNLVVNRTLNIFPKINVAGVSSGEISILQSLDTCIFIWRSNFTMNNVNIRGDIANDFNIRSYFLRPIYLQKKSVSLHNLDVQLTGYFLITTDPLTMDLLNIYIDFHAMMGGFWMNINCNYPEAYLEGKITSKNITAVNPVDRVAPFRVPLFVTSGPEDIYLEDTNLLIWGSLNEDRAPIETTVTSDCMPDDDKDNTFTFVGTKMTLTDNPGEDKFINQYVDIVQNAYRKFIVSYISNEFTNMYRMSYPSILVYSNPMTEVSLVNSTFTNVTTINGGIMVTLIKSILIENVIFKDCDEFTFATINLLEADSLTIKNLTHQNVSGIGSSFERYVRIKMNSGGIVDLKSVNFLNCDIKLRPAVYLEGAVAKLQLKHSNFENVKVGTSNSIIVAQDVSTLEFENCTFTSITSSIPNDEDNLIFNIQNLDLDSAENSTISVITVRSSQISFLSFNSIQGILSSAVHIGFSSLTFEDCAFTSSISMLSLGGLETKEEISFSFTGLTYQNISFISQGNLMKFQHQMNTPVAITNSTFTNISAGNIHIESANKNNQELTTRVAFSSCTFSQIDDNYGSLMEVYEGARVTIEDSNFQEIYTLEEGAVIFAGNRKAQIEIRNSTFRENSAVTGGVFNIESSSVIKVYDSLFSNNFAVQACVIYAVNFGSFEIYNTTVTQNNAVANSFARIFDAPTTSIINNSTIYENNGLTSEEVTSELTIACSKLCFLSEKFKAYLLANPNVYSIVSSSYVIQVIIGALEINNFSNFYHDSEILDVSDSTLTIQNMDFHNLSEVHNVIKVSSSTVSMDTVKFYEIESATSSTTPLIRFAYECVLTLNNLEYYNSSAAFLSISASLGNISMLSFHEVHVNTSNPRPIIELDGNTEMLILDWYVVNTSTSSEYLVTSDHNSVVSIKNMTFTGIRQSPISFSSCTIGTMDQININSCSRGIVLLQSSFSQITNSSFNELGSSSIQSGGAIFIKDCNGSISDSNFMSNTAITGAAIDFSCSLTSVCQSSLINNTFTDNKAVSKGGALHYDMFRPILQDNTFLYNSAPYGPDIASYPIQIKKKGTKGGTLFLSDVGSGIKYQNTLTFAFYDHDEQILSLDSSSQITISGNSTGSSVLGVKAVKVTSGEAIFDDLQFISAPGAQTVLYDIESGGLDLQKLKIVYGDTYQQEKISVNFRYCQPGEHNTTSCEECSPGTYSFTWNSTQCLKCIEDATCEGGKEVSINPGYWRKHTNSTDITECPNKDACNGGFSETDRFPVNCAAGYQGYLCTQCISDDQSRYGQVDSFVCEKCPEPILNALRVIGISTAVIIFLCLLIFMNIRKKDESQKSILMRILTNHLQLTTLTFAYNMKFPDIFLDLLSPLSRVNSSSQSIVSFDCFASESQLKLFTPSIAILKVGLSALSPLILLSGCLIFFLICHSLFPRYFSDFKRNMVVSIISIVYFLHPTISTSAFGIFQCIEVGEGESRMRLDLNIGCYSSDHLIWAFSLGLPMIIVWVIGAPLLALRILYKHRTSLRELQTKRYLIVMYQGFKEKYYYWEILNMARKILLLGINVFLPESSTTAKGGLAIIIVCFLYRLQIQCYPFKMIHNNNLELTSSVATGVTLTAGLIFASDETHDILDFCIFIFICILNLKFFLNWTYLMLIECESSMTCLKKITIVLGAILNKRRENYLPSDAKANIIDKRVKIHFKSRKRHNKKRLHNKKGKAKIRKKNKKIMINDSFSDVDLVMAKRQREEHCNINEERQDMEDNKRNRRRRSQMSMLKQTKNVEVFQNTSLIGIKNLLARNTQKASIEISKQIPEQKYQRNINAWDKNEGIEDLGSYEKGQNMYEETKYKGDQNSEENKHNENNRDEEEKILAKMLINNIATKSIKSNRNFHKEKMLKIDESKKYKIMNKKLKKDKYKPPLPTYQVQIKSIIPLDFPSNPSSRTPKFPPDPKHPSSFPP
ncbi:unnamed protein product [Moneuplotes crassus]|uniref:Uncharacterized protein n=1 Tax=Euplotes crassus TaxID=5936 RepID=A0AAD1XVS6_EUPCR|nr:unnamed protein product [Moneuplotes crassus]